MKHIKLDLTHVDGNAFALLAAFRKQARKENWTQEEINEVISQAKSGDYSNLIGVLMAHCD